MRPFRHPRRPRGPAPASRLALVLCLSPLLAGALCFAPRPVHAQSSTLVYGSDTQYPDLLTPPLRITGSFSNISGILRLGSSNSPAANYASAFDPDPVDVSKGFVARLFMNSFGANGIALVIKDPANPDDVGNPVSPARGTSQGLGADLPSRLVVAFVNFDYSQANHDDRHFKEVQVYAIDAAGVTTPLGDVQGLDIASGPGAILQVRYLPRFSTLDVYVGPKLITRVPNVDLAARGITPGGMAGIGFTTGVPGRVQSTGNNSTGYDFEAAHLVALSLSNQLVFGSGFGPNFYEDRFPFQTLRQSVWNGPDTVKFTQSVEAKDSWEAKVKDPVGIPGVFSLQPGAFAKNYDVGLKLEMDATGGTADISYPVFLDMLLPTQYSADPGQSFPVPVSFYPDPAATLGTTSPGANVTSDLIFGGEFGFSLNTSVLGTSLSSGNVVDVKIPTKDIKIFDLNEILASGLIPNVNGGVNYAGYVQGTEGATGTKNTTEHGTPGKGSAEGAKKGSALSDFVQVSITYPPDLSTSGSVPFGASNATHLTSAAGSPLVTLLSDFTNDILGFIPGLDILPAIPFFNNDYSLNLAGYPVELGIHLADLYGSVNLGAHVDYDFAPQPQVWLLLSDPNDSTKAATLGPFAFDAATNMVKNPPSVRLPANGDPLTITPVLTLSSAAFPDGLPDFKTTSGNKFKTNGQLTIGGSLSFNPFEFSYKFGDNSFNSSAALGLPFPYTLAGNIPIVTYPLAPFEIGTQNGGAAEAVPFQTTLSGKPFTLFPRASKNPLIDAVASDSAPVQRAGAGGSLPITLTCEQAYLSGQVVWDYNGDPYAPQTAVLAYNRQNASLVTSAVPDALLSAVGLHTLTLINQDGTGNTYPSNSVSFVVTAPAPSLGGIRPLTPGGRDYRVVAGGGGFKLVASGQDFLPPHTGTGGAMDYVGSVVQWNGQPLPTTYVDDGHLTATVPSNLVKTTATDQISVSTAGPGGGQSSALALTPVNTAPVLLSLSQSGSQPGSSGLTLDLNGSGFLPGSSVAWSDGTTSVTKTPTYQGPSNLTLALVASDLSTPGARTIQVRNPAPGGGVSAAQTFTIGQYATGGGVIFVPSLSRTAAGFQLQLTVVNTSRTVDAAGTLVLSATAQATGGQPVSPILPSPLQAFLVGTVPAAQSVTPAQTYTFPASIGAPGQSVILTIQGSVGGKAFTTRLRAMLPSTATS